MGSSNIFGARGLGESQWEILLDEFTDETRDGEEKVDGDSDFRGDEKLEVRGRGPGGRENADDRQRKGGVVAEDNPPIGVQLHEKSPDGKDHKWDRVQESPTRTRLRRNWKTG